MVYTNSTAYNNLHEQEKSPFLMYFYYRNKTMPHKEQHNYFDNRISYSIFNINVLQQHIRGVKKTQFFFFD